MAAVTSVMRAQQLLLSRVEDTLKPYGLTFAAYEALRLLAFSRRGSLPMGKMGARLMVHPASVTNAITRLEQRGLVERRLSPDDRRVVLATITPDGQALVREATDALNQASFGLPDLTAGQAAEVTSTLRALRVAGGDAAAGTRMPGGRPRPRPARPAIRTVPASLIRIGSLSCFASLRRERGSTEASAGLTRARPG